MKLVSPNSKNRFLILSLAAWAGVIIADALAIYIYLLMPHNPNSDSPGAAIEYWKLFAIGWAYFSPIFFLPVAFAYTRYKGRVEIIRLSNDSRFRAIACWCLNIYALLLLIPELIALAGFWQHGEYLFTYFVISIPTTTAAAFFTYAMFSATAQILNAAKNE